jgi:acetoin utilization deacetylase AcuC-like enzyme
MHTLLLTHPDCLRHDTGVAHPECADRLRAITHALEREEFCYLIREAAPKATREQLLLAHSADYIDRIHALLPQQGEYFYLDDDTVISAHSFDAALRAAGSVVAAVDEIAAGRCENAFCAVRPPGHHAERDSTMGFCLFSNAAIGALHAKAAHGYARVAVVDFDVHHGNGTQEVLRPHAGTFYASTHQQDLFPFSGEADDFGAEGGALLVNAPLPADSGPQAFRHAYEAVILPRLRAFAPDFLFISAGFDGHAADAMSDLQLHVQDFDWVTRRLLEVAQEYSGMRLVSVLEGGYDLPALTACVASHLRILMGR